MSAKTKDGFYKVNYDNTYVLLANGLQQKFGNDTNNIPVSNGTVNSNLNADLLDGLHIHTGINNEVNKIVRTNSDGTIMAGWINTISGDMTTTPFTRVYVSNDQYIRYVSNTNFIKGIGGPFLPLAGGTMTGTIHREYTSSDDTPFIWINSGNYDNYIFQVSSSTTSKQYYGYALKYIGTGSGIKKFLRLYADNQNGTDIIAIGINQSGNVGIGADALDSYRFYVNGTSVFTGHLYPEATNTYDLGSSSLRWRKLYIGSADSYGNATKPIYWNSGVPTACTYSLNANVNSGNINTLAYYIAATTISSYTSTTGSNTKLFYLNAGVPTESTGSVGSGIIPIYLLGGTLTASTSTVGATNKPIWMNGGTLTAFTSTIGASDKPIWMNAGVITASTSSIGSGVKPIYMSSGQILASTSTVGGTLQPVWLSSGVITAFTTTKGSTITGVYLASGVISEMTYSLGSSVSAGTANRIAWYSGANVISSGTITTDGAYLGSISYLSINTTHQTSYRLYVNGTTRSDNFISSVATGTQPYACSSTTLNTNLNADLLDGIHSSGFLGWTCMTAIGTSAPFQDSVDYFKNLSNLNNGGRMVYNYPGNEYTILYTRRNDSTAHGSILKWGYPDKYIRIIRMISGNPQSSDWEKIAAGNADVWTTARTLTIGNTGKSVDGSSNVSWSFDEIGVYNKSTSDDRYVNVSGDWMNTDAQIYFRGLNSSTSVYGSIGFRDSFNGKMHLGSDTYNTKALYVCSNGYNAANDCGGIAIDNDGVTAFGAGDTGSVFRVVNEDNVADGSQFLVTKASGAAVKYNLSIGQNTVNTSYKLYVNGNGCFENNIRINSSYPHIDMYSTGAESSIYFRPNSGTSWAIGKAPWGVGGFGIGILNTGCQFTILDNGNTGIGTTSPSQKLHVSGNEYITGYINFNDHGYLRATNTTSFNYGYSLSLGDSNNAMGMFSGPGGKEGAVIVSPDTCIIYNSFDQGYGFAVFDKDRGGDLTTATSRVFSVDQGNYFAWSRGGFVKEGSDNNYALTGGGGHFAIHTGRNNEANKLVRTDANGYIQAGWINTTSGDMGTTGIDRVYCSNDGYIRYKTKANFVNGLDAYWANVKVSATSSTSTSPTFNHVYLNAYLHMVDSGGTMRSTIDRSGNSPIFGYGQGQAGYHVYYTGGTVSINGGTSWSATANAIYINASNNVGIGTNSPQVKLHVSGGLAVINDSTNTTYDALGYFRNYSNMDWGVIVDKSQSYTYGLDVRAAGDYAFKVSTGKSRFVGAVCIGADAAANYTLDVRGDTYISGYAGIGKAPDSTLARLRFPYNEVAIEFREASYRTAIQYMTAGNEALVFSAQQAVTSFIFKCGYSLSNSANWHTEFNTTNNIPSIQIKNQSLYVNAFIGNGVSPGYNFYVGGTAFINGRTIISSGNNANSTDSWKFKIIQGSDCGSGPYDTAIISSNDVPGVRISDSDGTQLGLCGGDYHCTLTSTHDFRFYTGCTTNTAIYSGGGGTLRVGMNYGGYPLYVNGYSFATSGFVKNGSSDSYVLLGGGGHKALSDFSMSGHSHSYLPLAGGTMTGTIAMNGASFEQVGKRWMYGTVRNSGFKYDYYGNEAFIISAGTYGNARISFYTCGHLNMNDSNGQWNATTADVYIHNNNLYIANSGYASSDIRKKYDIRNILEQDVIDLFNTENGYIRHFKWKSNNQSKYGFIAQEIQEYCPEAIDIDSEGYLFVNYDAAICKIIGAMFKKIKEQDRIIKDLQKRMEAH